MITLPNQPNRVELRSFALAFGGVAGAVVGAAAWRTGQEAWAVYAVAVALLLSVPGVFRPNLVGHAYIVWNRIADVMARAARFVLTLICFAVVAAAGRAGSRLQRRAASAHESGWQPRARIDVESFGGQSARSWTLSSGLGWTRAYLQWTRGSGNEWASALLPFLLLIRALRIDETGSLDDRIYTLF